MDVDYTKKSKKMKNNNVFYLANERFFYTSTVITYRAAVIAE